MLQIAKLQLSQGYLLLFAICKMKGYLLSIDSVDSNALRPVQCFVGLCDSKSIIEALNFK